MERISFTGNQLNDFNSLDTHKGAADDNNIDNIATIYEYIGVANDRNVTELEHSYILNLADSLFASGGGINQVEHNLIFDAIQTAKTHNIANTSNSIREFHKNLPVIAFTGNRADDLNTLDKLGETQANEKGDGIITDKNAAEAFLKHYVNNTNISQTEITYILNRFDDIFSGATPVSKDTFTSLLSLVDKARNSDDLGKQSQRIVFAKTQFNDIDKLDELSKNQGNGFIDDISSIYEYIASSRDINNAINDSEYKYLLDLADALFADDGKFDSSDFGELNRAQWHAVNHTIGQNVGNREYSTNLPKIAFTGDVRKDLQLLDRYNGSKDDGSIEAATAKEATEAWLKYLMDKSPNISAEDRSYVLNRLDDLFSSGSIGQNSLGYFPTIIRKHLSK